MRVITVVMGEPESTTRNKETTDMLNYSFNMYSIEKMLSKDKKVGTIKINLGENETSDIVPVKDVNILNNKQNEKRNVIYDVETYKVTAPVKKGDIVGKLKVIENDKILEEIEITIPNDIKKVNIFKAYLRNIKSMLIGNSI